MTLRAGHPTRVRLPYLPDGGNYKLLREIRGPGTHHPRYDSTTKEFVVPRNGTNELLAGLIARFSRIEVTVVGVASTTCVAACWDGNPDTVLECECACAGSNHGTGRKLGNEVLPGVSVEHDYTTARYEVTARGAFLLT